MKKGYLVLLAVALTPALRAQTVEACRKIEWAELKDTPKEELQTIYKDYDHQAKFAMDLADADSKSLAKHYNVQIAANQHKQLDEAVECLQERDRVGELLGINPRSQPIQPETPESHELLKEEKK